MKYRSTRGSKENTLNSAAAIIQGLAPDGGLFVYKIILANLLI